MNDPDEGTGPTGTTARGNQVTPREDRQAGKAPGGQEPPDTKEMDDATARGGLEDREKNVDAIARRGHAKPALPAPIDPFAKENRPKRGQPLTVLRFLRALAMLILAIALLSSFGYSIMLAVLSSNLLVNPPPAGLLDFRESLSVTVSILSLVGFILLGIASEGKDRAAEIQRIINERKQRMKDFGLTEEQAKLVQDEFMPSRVKGKKAKLFFFGMAIACLGAYGMIYFASGMTEQIHVLATYGLTGAVISTGFILAGFAGELNVEIWRAEIFGIRVHEAAIGIFFVIIAVPLLYFGSSIDKILAAFYIFTGAFLIGRDWKDVSAGKVVERARQE